MGKGFMMQLVTTVKNRGPRSWVISFDGRLDSGTVRRCADDITKVLEQDVRVLLLDMEKLSFVSSIGIRLVLNVRKKVESKGGTVAMTHLQPQIAKVFEIAQVLPSQSIFESVEEADRYYEAIQRKVINNEL